MDKETRNTYIIVGATVVILAGIAFFLQPLPVGKSTASQKNENYQIDTTKNTVKENTTSQITANNKEQKPMDQQTFQSATITTNKGVIEVAFVTNTPKTVKNFGTLATSKFYDGVRFHRVIKGFMIQAGDPLSKDKASMSTWGTGGPGYKFEDELTGNEQYPLGTLAMANAGPNTNGSQFFIVTANPGAPLPPNYTVFGHVTKGIEVAQAIENVSTAGSPSDRPLEDVIIEKIEAK